ncbi:MAG: hypothetical protein HC904_04990 [Blastochloris sp.]|nr:hypothetical protein [Blastochloris sp.]
MIKALTTKRSKQAGTKEALFIRRARRAMLHASKKVAAENKHLGLPMVLLNVNDR